MQEFLIEIQSSRHADYGALAEIMAGRVGSTDESVRAVALRWLRDFVLQAKERLLPHYAAILGAILPALANSNADTRQVGCVTHTCSVYFATYFVACRTFYYKLFVYLVFFIQLIYQ